MLSALARAQDGSDAPMSEIDRTRRGPAPAPDLAGLSVLVFLLDDLGVEFMDWMGVGGMTTDPAFAYARTPFLSSIARTHGVWFSQFYASSRCDPSRVMLHTGLLQHRTGVGQNVPTSGHSQFAVPGSFTFLPEHLRSVDPSIATGVFGKWQMCDFHAAPVPNDGPEHPPNLNLSDPERFGYQKALISSQNFGGSYAWWRIVDGGPPGWISAPPFTERTYSNGVVGTEAAAWLAARTTRFFAYVAIGPPHSPIRVPPFTMLSSATTAELAGMGLAPGDHPTEGYTNPASRLAYRASIESSDMLLERLWNAIPSALRATTCLIVLGDNGTSKGLAPRPFVHHKDELYNGGLQVPCLVRAPFVVRQGREIRAMASIEDVFRTVAEIMGCPIGDPDTARDSVSFLPALLGAVDARDVRALKPYVISQEFTPVGVTDPSLFDPLTRGRSITDGRFRYVNPKARGQGPGLFDRRGDPFETHDVKAAHPQKFHELEDALFDVLPI
jgi:arylsulfatase A-like enzyme